MVAVDGAQRLFAAGDAMRLQIHALQHDLDLPACRRAVVDDQHRAPAALRQRRLRRRRRFGIWLRDVVRAGRWLRVHRCRPGEAGRTHVHRGEQARGQEGFGQVHAVGAAGRQLPGGDERDQAARIVGAPVCQRDRVVHRHNIDVGRYAGFRQLMAERPPRQLAQSAHALEGTQLMRAQSQRSDPKDSCGHINPSANIWRAIDTRCFVSSSEAVSATAAGGGHPNWRGLAGLFDAFRQTCRRRGGDTAGEPEVHCHALARCRSPSPLTVALPRAAPRLAS